MHFLVTCKNEDQIKNESAKSGHNISPIISLGFFPDAEGTANTAAYDHTLQNFELIQDFMVVLVTSKNEENPIKNESQHTWELSVTIRSGQNNLPHDDDAPDKIWM